MQTQGKDTVIETHIGTNGQQLNFTTTGWQFGANRDRSLITDLAQVIGPDPAKPLYPQNVQDQVASWLKGNGVQKAKQDLVDREVAEEASEQPGSLDAMADKLGASVKSQLFQMMKAALKGEGVLTPPSPSAFDEETSRTVIDGVPVVEDAKGIKHRLPDPALVQHPKVQQVDGGFILDKGNGHKEFRSEYHGEESEQEEAAILAARNDDEVSTYSKKNAKKKR